MEVASQVGVSSLLRGAFEIGFPVKNRYTFLELHYISYVERTGSRPIPANLKQEIENEYT